MQLPPQRQNKPENALHRPPLGRPYAGTTVKRSLSDALKLDLEVHASHKKEGSVSK